MLDFLSDQAMPKLSRTPCPPPISKITSFEKNIGSRDAKSGYSRRASLRSSLGTPSRGRIVKNRGRPCRPRTTCLPETQGQNRKRGKWSQEPVKYKPYSSLSHNATTIERQKSQNEQTSPSCQLFEADRDQ
jgi:hypothetical protein